MATQIVLELTDVAGGVHLLSLVGKTSVLDTPNSRRSRPFLLAGSSVSLAMPSVDNLARGYVGGLAERKTGRNPRILNKRERETDARTADFLFDKRVENSVATFYATSEDPPPQDLSDPLWATFTAQVVRIQPIGVDELEVVLKPGIATLDDQQLSGVRTYWALGDACLVFDSTADEISISSGSALEPSLARSWCFELVGVTLFPGDLVNDAVWFQWGNGSTTGITLTTDVGGNANIRLEVFGLTTDTITTANGVLVEGREPYTVSIRRDAEIGEIAILLNGDVVASAASTGTITDPAPAAITLGTLSSVWSAMGEMRFWSTAPTDDVIASNHDARIVITPLPPGLVDVWRDGAGTVWPAVIDTPTNDSDGSQGTPTFGYGFEGQPDQHEGWTHPKAFGQVEFILPEYVWPGAPADFVCELHHGDQVTKFNVFDRGVKQTAGASGAGDYDMNEPGDGLIEFHVDPAPLADIRVSATGVPVDDGEELIVELGFGLTLKSPDFVDGIALDLPVGLYLKSKQDGYDSADVLREVCRALDCVVTEDDSGEIRAIRVPPESWAVPVGSNDHEADATIIEGVHFTAESNVRVDGDASPGIYSARMRHRVVVDKSEPRDVDLTPGDAAAYAFQRHMVRDHLEAEWTQGEDFKVANPGHVRGSLVPSLYVTEADAREDARRRALGVMSQRGCRVIKIRQLLRAVPGIYKLGARVVVKSGVLGQRTGIPCLVTAFDAPLGELQLLEMRRARLQPDEIVATTNFNATVAEVSDHPLLVSADFADSTGTPCNFTVGFPEPPTVDASSTHTFRLRISATTDDVNLFSIGLFDAGIGVKVFEPVVVTGSPVFDTSLVAWVIAAGTTVVFAVKWELSDVADLTDIGANFNATLASGSSVAKVFAFDWEYIVR